MNFNKIADTSFKLSSKLATNQSYKRISSLRIVLKYCVIPWFTTKQIFPGTSSIFDDTLLSGNIFWKKVIVSVTELSLYLNRKCFILHKILAWIFPSSENVSVVVDCPVFKQVGAFIAWVDFGVRFSACSTSFSFHLIWIMIVFLWKSCLSLSILLLFYNALYQWHGFLKLECPCFPIKTQFYKSLNHQTITKLAVTYVVWMTLIYFGRNQSYKLSSKESLQSTSRLKQYKLIWKVRTSIEVPHFVQPTWMVNYYNHIF